jgi:hypothetical protein
MSRSAVDLVQRYDIDAEAVEALLQRYGDPEPIRVNEDLTARESLVRETLEAAGDHPLRTSSDHYYQFTRSERAEDPVAPDTETEFTAILDALVEDGVVARTNDQPPLYSTSYYKILSELPNDLTASEIEELCAETGMPKRQVYYHIFTDLQLDADLTT